MPLPAATDLPPRLTRTERDLLERVPRAQRAATLRRMLAALDPPDAAVLLAAIRRRPDARDWLEGLRDVA